MLWNDSSDMVCQKGGARLLRKQQVPAAPCTPHSMTWHPGSCHVTLMWAFCGMARGQSFLQA